jgi:hypothetical protein
LLLWIKPLLSFFWESLLNGPYTRPLPTRSFFLKKENHRRLVYNMYIYIYAVWHELVIQEKII